MTGAMIASTAISAASAGYSAYSQNKQGRVQQQVNEYNARVAGNQAIEIGQETKAQIAAKNREGQRLLSRQKALMAKGGVMVGTGSPLLIQASQLSELELENQNIAWQGDKEVRHYRQSAELDRLQGRVARDAGRRSATGTLLQNGSRTFSRLSSSGK